MSTNNFYKKNASKYYAVEINEDWEYDDLVADLQHQFGTENAVNKWNGERNYEGKIISRFDGYVG